MKPSTMAHTLLKQATGCVYSSAGTYAGISLTMEAQSQRTEITLQPIADVCAIKARCGKWNRNSRFRIGFKRV